MKIPHFTLIALDLSKKKNIDCFGLSQTKMSSKPQIQSVKNFLVTK